MQIIKNVAVIGATGRVGSVLVRALDTSGKFSIKILTRQRTTKYDSLPASLQQSVFEIDFASHSALVAALTGIDAVVVAITFPNPLLADIEIPIIRAAIEAGVKLFIPSEWAVDTTKHIIPTNRIVAPKRAVHQYLSSKSDQIGYALIYMGLFPDVLITLGVPYHGTLGQFGIDIANRQAKLPDGGVHPFSGSAHITAGSALVAVLAAYPKSHNRVLHFSDGVMTPLEVLSIVEKVTNSKFTRDSYSLAEISAFAEKEASEGKNDIGLWFGTLRLPFMGGKESSVFSQVDNDEFGVERADLRVAVEDAVRRVIATNK